MSGEDDKQKDLQFFEGLIWAALPVCAAFWILLIWAMVR